MKIAVVGKGGSGKTTVAAILARSLAAQGRSVIALDCDTNPNLGLSLGFGLERTNELAAIRQSMDEAPEGEAVHAESAAELLARFGASGPDGVRLAVVNKIEKPNPGCP
ncbi:MAG: AAA family ATPase [Chloroflexota bacterium]|nr:AAA family ATPase [Chloroflexota bacterium]